MTRAVQPVVSRLARQACPSRRLVSTAARLTTTTATTATAAAAKTTLTVTRPRLFSSTPLSRTPFRSSRPLFAPPPPPPPPSPPYVEPTPANLTTTQYHALADEYLERLVGYLEAMQDLREDVDVEYSSGVLTLSLAANSDGSGGTRTYVINKQPPNKQIWLSSPLSGPKRYDWVVDGADGDGDGDGSAGRWIYLKDGSALDALLLEEVGVDMTAPVEE